jgi:hypothetical protein
MMRWLPTLSRTAQPNIDLSRQKEAPEQTSSYPLYRLNKSKTLLHLKR